MPISKPVTGTKRMESASALLLVLVPTLQSEHGGGNGSFSHKNVEWAECVGAHL